MRMMKSGDVTLRRLVWSMTGFVLAAALLAGVLLSIGTEPVRGQELIPGQIPPDMLKAQQCDDGKVAIGKTTLTGSGLARFNDLELSFYVLGYIDAALASPVYAATSQCLELVVACVSQRRVSEMVVELRAFMARHPRSADVPASGLLYDALFRRCIAESAKNRATAF